MASYNSSMLISRGVSLYRSILSSSPDIDGNGKCLREWLEYEKTVGTATASGSLDSHAASAIFMIVSNVSAVAASREALEQECEDVMSTLTQKVQNLGVTGDHHMISKRRSNYDDSDRHRTSKRSCRPTTTKYLPTPSPPPSSPNKSLKPSSNTTTKFAQPPAPDPVRQYFLTHLSSPYPTPTEKEKLCKKAKITRRKLESDLTNWRRRSDWTDIMNTYCGGDKGSMKTMISVIECGEERDVELLARFGRMKAYLEKRDEQAGEWVYQLAEMVKSGRLDEMRFQQIDEDNSDTNSNSGSDSEGEQEDAEGESEDGYRSHPVTPLKELPKYGKQVFGPYTTVPLDMTIPIPLPNVKAESPLTDLSPSSVGSHVASKPSISPYDAYLNAKVQHPPPITYTHNVNQQASAKSSYSSLSAASSMVGPRKRNISDSSTSSNLRSTSGSSTSSFQRQGRESFSRSRSRVDDILSDNNTTSPWVNGHAPGHAFHIGYDPRYRSQPQYRPLPTPPPAYEMGPYVMAPSGWSSYEAMPTPMAHMSSSGGKGGFTIPSEYDFTFEHGHQLGQGIGQGHGYGDNQGHARAQ